MLDERVRDVVRAGEAAHRPGVARGAGGDGVQDVGAWTGAGDDGPARAIPVLGKRVLATVGAQELADGPRIIRGESGDGGETAFGADARAADQVPVLGGG